MTQMVSWRSRAGDECNARLLTGAFSARVPARIEAVDDTLSADTAFRKASEGTALVWEGDFQNARQLLSALARRLDVRKQDRAAKASKSNKSRTAQAESQPAGAVQDASVFHAYRMAQSNRARILGMIWVVLDQDYQIQLNRSPDVALACEQAFGRAKGRQVIALRELLGVVGAAQWREKGVAVAELGAKTCIFPHYGVFSPVRGEYLDMVNTAPIQQGLTAWDVGTGTGVLAAILARRGVARVVATDNNEQALACARENIERLGLQRQVDVVHADMFPAGKADLIVCNPPWLPAKPTSTIELAIYDADSRMLTAFVQGLRERLNPGGEGWLILSDLAVRLGLRRDTFFAELLEQAGLQVVHRMDRKPIHAKALDADDPLAKARAGEVTSLWRLAVKPA